MRAVGIEAHDDDHDAQRQSGKVSLEVPADPQRIAVLDMAVLDMLDSWGLGGRVVGMPKSSTVDYLKTYNENEAIVNLGTLKEVDMEALMASEPDLIFIGGRLSAQYDALSEIAPVVYLSTDAELGVVESVKQNAMTVASLFNMEDKAKEQLAGFDSRIETLPGGGRQNRGDRHGHFQQLQYFRQWQPVLVDRQ